MRIIRLTRVLWQLPLLWVCICYTSVSNASPGILTLLNVIPSAASKDYVENKKQFQLQNLLTEQRHPKTLQLSYEVAGNTQQGLASLFSVDEDIAEKFAAMAQDPAQMQVLTAASQAIQTALLQHKKIYLYGTGATGRLAEQIESALWRPFWEKMQRIPMWHKIKPHMPEITESVIGEITGGDRALVSSLEGFEDLQLIGKLQLASHHIQPGDVVFAITEGGETSAVIGTILTAANMNAAKPQKNLYFIYNNPDAKLLPFDRSRAVIQNAQITKINLTTGPQAITGSTRMQATSSEFFLIGSIFEDALSHILKRYLSEDELQQLGLQQTMSLQQRLLSFAAIQQRVSQAAAQIAPWTELETKTYAAKQHATYYAKQALLQVFTDITERGPTFSLPPLDTIQAGPRMSWVQVWTEAKNKSMAWQALLHRPFRGLTASWYESEFSNDITDPYLRVAALRSLEQASDEQRNRYDFSFSQHNIEKYGPMANDLGVLILLNDEIKHDPSFYKFLEFLEFLAKRKANAVVVLIMSKQLTQKERQAIKIKNANTKIISLVIPGKDPLGLKQQIALKMLLNAHSTAVMAKLGRVVGNTMAYVRPSNLKLIGRATYLIQIHVNEALKSAAWLKRYGNRPAITYAEANAILYDAIAYTKDKHETASEVALSIVRILQTLKYNRAITWSDASAILSKQGISVYWLPYGNYI